MTVDLRKRKRAPWYQLIALFFAGGGLFCAIAGEMMMAGMCIVVACAWMVVKPFARRRR